MIRGTLIIMVWNEDANGYRTSADCFDSLSDACAYAVANKAKIACGLPAVEKHYYYYNPTAEIVRHQIEVMEPKEIELIAFNETQRRKW